MIIFCNHKTIIQILFNLINKNDENLQLKLLNKNLIKNYKGLILHFLIQKMNKIETFMNEDILCLIVLKSAEHVSNLTNKELINTETEVKVIKNILS